MALAIKLNASFDAGSFRNYMSIGHRFLIDLSNSNLLDVMSAYETFNKKTSPRFSNATVRHMIEGLESVLDNQSIMPVDVTDEFYSFVSGYLLSGSSGRVLRPSTISHYFDCIRASLSWARLHNCPISETYNRYKVDRYEKTKVILTPEMIAHINYFDIDANKEIIKKYASEHNLKRFSFTVLAKVRDHFVLACNLGQRYSDSSRIDPSMFDSTKTIYKTTQQKTGGKAVVFMTKYAITREIIYDILKRYNYTSPVYGMNIGNYNKYLHLLLHSIGNEFNELIKTENKILGEIVTESVPMWKMISSHTARRTFATNGLLRGMSIPQIQKCTGHRDLRALSSYTVLSDID